MLQVSTSTVAIKIVDLFAIEKLARVFICKDDKSFHSVRGMSPLNLMARPPMLMSMNKKKKYDKHFDKTFKDVLREQYDKLQQEKLFEERRILNEFASEWNTQYITHFYSKEGLCDSMIGFG